MAMVQATEQDIALLANLLNAARIDSVVVMRIGQGNATKLLNQNNDIMFYVDVGCGALFNHATRPANMSFDFTNSPPIILSHWDYDHWWAGARVEQDAHNSAWLAPRQTVSPMHQNLAQQLGNNLRLWPRGDVVNANFAWAAHLDGWGTRLHLIRATGAPDGDRNRSGIAVLVETRSGDDESRVFLLPGDAPFQDIDWAGEITWRTNNPVWFGLIATHHGSNTHLEEDQIPDPPNAVGRQVIYSFGNGNCYHHPRAEALQKYRNQNWDQAHETATSLTVGGAVPADGNGPHGADVAFPMPANADFPALVLGPPADDGDDGNDGDGMVDVADEVDPQDVFEFIEVYIDMPFDDFRAVLAPYFAHACPFSILRQQVIAGEIEDDMSMFLQNRYVELEEPQREFLLWNLEHNGDIAISRILHLVDEEDVGDEDYNIAACFAIIVAALRLDY